MEVAGSGAVKRCPENVLRAVLSSSINITISILILQEFYDLEVEPKFLGILML